jgi:hypothetical protein
MKNITGRLLVLSFAAVALVSSALQVGCRQNFPSQVDSIFVHDTVLSHSHDTLWYDSCESGTNLLTNGGFDLASTATHDLSNGEMAGWDVYKGTPQAVPQFGGRTGLLQMWGNGDASIGEGVTQTLRTPLVSGKQYIISADFYWWNDNPDNYTPYARLRFIAYDDYGNSATIATLQTNSTSWTHMTAPAWVAGSNFTHVAIMVEDDNTGTNSATWARVDGVKLSEKI